LRIGLDIGGTKVELAALDEAGRERLRMHVPAPRAGYGDAVEALVAMIADAERKLGAGASVGIGLPGRVAPDSGLVSNAFNTVFNGQPLKADLERRLGREVRIENDANCFALSETLDGAARGALSVFGIVLGTGAGGGIVIGGRLHSGANALAGEWGHNPLPWMTAGEFPGPRCSCGRLGCIEQFVSGTALGADHERETGKSLAPVEIAAAAARGDAACEASLARLEHRLARALAHVINLLDPEVIVVGGGLSALDRIYENVPRLWKGYAYAGDAHLRFIRAEHGAASGVRGAAMLWPASP
jgi:fructokinase